MKIVRGSEKKWEPIVITLESKEEAQYMYHCLNVSDDDKQEWASRYVPVPENVESMCFWGQYSSLK